MTSIINKFISEGTFPNSWNSAAISSIYKSGDPASVSNYRPISILSAVSKVAEKLVAEQLTVLTT